MTTITRETLIELCERAIVPERSWCNRDSARAQTGVGECWALLKAGCDYEILTTGTLTTDDRTIWIRFFPHGFSTKELGREEGREYDSETFYLPNEKRLDEADGKDWY